MGCSSIPGSHSVLRAWESGSGFGVWGWGFGVETKTVFTTESVSARHRWEADWKREIKLPWREASPPNHHDDKVDSDQ